MPVPRREFMKKVGLTILSVAIAPHFLERLVDNVYLFNINGQSEFPVYGGDGGVSTESVSYLIFEDKKKCWAFNPRVESMDEAMRKFKVQL